MGGRGRWGGGTGTGWPALGTLWPALPGRREGWPLGEGTQVSQAGGPVRGCHQSTSLECRVFSGSSRGTVRGGTSRDPLPSAFRSDRGAVRLPRAGPLPTLRRGLLFPPPGCPPQCPPPGSLPQCPPAWPSATVPTPADQESGGPALVPLGLWATAPLRAPQSP